MTVDRKRILEEINQFELDYNVTIPKSVRELINPTAGYVLVPEEPTEAMVYVGNETYRAPIGMCPANTKAEISIRLFKAYKAMIASRPKTVDQ